MQSTRPPVPLIGESGTPNQPRSRPHFGLTHRWPEPRSLAGWLDGNNEPFSEVPVGEGAGGVSHHVRSSLSRYMRRQGIVIA